MSQSDSFEAKEEEKNKTSEVQIHTIQLPQVYEEGLRKKLNRWAQIKCKEEIGAFVNCSKDKFLNVIWECKDLNNVMNSCLHKYTSEWYMGQLRHKYLTGELQKKKKVNDKEEKNEDLNTDEKEESKK